MNATVKISSIFPKYLFWDIDYENLDIEQDKDIIIPRALYMTNKATFENDIQKLEGIYAPAQIISQLQQTKEFISNEVCKLVALRYAIPFFQRFAKSRKIEDSKP